MNSESETMIPYEGVEKYIFVSYSHLDKALVKKVLGRLYEDGYRFWYDQGIQAGEEWDGVVADQLAGSALLIAFLSKNYFASRACNYELRFASDEEIPILPVFLDDTCKPEYLPGWAKLRIGRTKSLLIGKTGAHINALFQDLYNVSSIQACKELKSDNEKKADTDTPEAVILGLLKEGVMSTKDIAEKTGLSANRIRYYLKIMQDEGIIRSEHLINNELYIVQNEADSDDLKRFIRRGDLDGFVDCYVSLIKHFYRIEYESVQQYLYDFEALIPYRNLFLDVLNDGIDGKTLAQIFENLYNKLCCIHTFDSERNSCRSDELDIFQLHIWELFVLTTACYLGKRQFDEIHDLLAHSYYLRSSILSNDIKAVSYTAFNYSSNKMEYWAAEVVKPGDGRRYYSVSGHLLCNCREYGKIYTKRSIAEADLFLFQVFRGLGLNDLKGMKIWFPRCYVYANNENSLWMRLGSRTYCETIMPLFGVSYIEDLKKVIEKCHYPEEIGYKDGFADPAPQIRDFVNTDSIGILP